nr:hyaluronan mediated motility receptor-like [Lytechinus pictus]
MFSKLKVTRFNEITGCAPGVGSYDVKDTRKVKGAAAVAMSDKSQRFRENKDSTSSLEDSVMFKSSSMSELRTPNKSNASMVKGVERRRNASTVSTPRHQAENGKIKQLEAKIKHLLIQETEMGRRLQQAQEKTEKLDGKLQAAYKEKAQLQAQLAKSEKQIIELSRAKDVLMNKVDNLESTHSRHNSTSEELDAAKLQLKKKEKVRLLNLRIFDNNKMQHIPF